MDERRRGHDGKSYPAHPLSTDDRRGLVVIVHMLRHAQRLSVREIVARLDEEYGIARSVGSVSSYLNDHDCPLCYSGAEFPHLNGEPECSGGQSGHLNTHEVDR